MTTPRTTDTVSRRAVHAEHWRFPVNRHDRRSPLVLGRAAATAVALLLGLVMLASSAAAAGTGKPQFYTDEFQFDFTRDDLTAICGVPVGETVNGYVQGWDRWNADGTYAGGNVHVDVSGTFYSAAASVPFRETTRSLDVGHPDGSDTGSVRGLMLLVVVPGQSAAVNAGRLV